MEPEIFKKIESANKPDFGDVLSKSFELFKKVWVEGMLHLLVTMGAVLPFALLIYVPVIGMAIEAEGRPHFNPFHEYPPVFIVGYGLMVLVFAFLANAISYAVVAHFYKVCQRADTGSPAEVGGYFVFLQRHFVKLLVLTLASFGIALLATLLCYLPIFYVMVPLQLAVVIFAFNPELSVSEIIKASFKLGNRFWLIGFGLIIVAGLISQLGVILCGVGVFATAYFAYIPLYYFYKVSIGFDEALPERSF